MESWIKLRKKLRRDPRLLVIARQLCNAPSVTGCNAPSVTPVTAGRVSAVTVLGALAALWMLADDYCGEDGILPGYTAEDIDREVELPGFTRALPADWCQILPDGSLLLPSYLEHNGETAKTRALTARRVARHRQGSGQFATPGNASRVTRESRTSNAASVTGCNAQTVTPVTQTQLLDKIREEKNKTPPETPPLEPAREARPVRYLSDAPHLAADTKRIVGHYRTVVRPGTPSGPSAQAAVAALLTQCRVSVEQLLESATRYGKLMDDQGSPGRYRKSAKAFYEIDGPWQDFLSEEDMPIPAPGTASEEANSLSGRISQALEEIERASK